MKFENITSCNVCGCKNPEKVYEVNFLGLTGLGDWREEITVCPDCGFIYAANPFNEDYLTNRYANLSKYEFDTAEYSLDLDKTYVKRTHDQHNFIFQNAANIKSVLEVGAASAYNLSVFKEKGIDVFGVEPSAINCESAKKRYDIDMYNGVFNDFIDNYPAREYDLIFLSHVLEHIVNPRDFIEKCKNINSKYIFIEVPTFDYKFQDEPFGMFCEEHVNYFTFESLYHMMKASGYGIVEASIPFRVESGFQPGYPPIVTLWEKGKVNENELSPIVRSIDLLKAYIKSSENNFVKVSKIIDSIPNTAKLAIWGTGNHTSRLLASTSLRDKNIIKYYDSDVKKHAYDILGKPIRSFVPEDITNNTVDTILISSFFSQKSIEKVIKKYDLPVKIITLY